MLGSFYADADGVIFASLSPRGDGSCAARLTRRRHDGTEHPLGELVLPADAPGAFALNDGALLYLGLVDGRPMLCRQPLADDGTLSGEIEPLLAVPTERYEAALTGDSVLLPRHADRCIFGDSWPVTNPETGVHGLLIAARALDGDPETRACIGWLRREGDGWRAGPPVFSPRRFHTLERPNWFAHQGVHYLLYTVRGEWGLPVTTNDPHQSGGCLYAMGYHGLRGTYRSPDDDLLVGGSRPDANGYPQPRARYAQAVQTEAGPALCYQLDLSPHPRDPSAGCVRGSEQPFALIGPRPLRILPGGEIGLGMPELPWQQLPVETLKPAAPWRRDADGLTVRHYAGPSAQPLPMLRTDGSLSAEVLLARGDRAGWLIGADDAAGSGLLITLDARHASLEFARLTARGRETLDRRNWYPTHTWVELAIERQDEQLRVYVDGKLLMHQVWYGHAGEANSLYAERASASFRAIRFTDRP